MIKLIIFDMDGVIVNSKPTYLQVLQKVIRNLGGDASFEEIDKYLGEPAPQFLRHFVAEDKVDKGRELIQEFITSDEIIKNVELCPEVKETITKLGGYKKAIITNSDDGFVSSVLDLKEVRSFFDDVLTANFFLEAKEERCAYLFKKFGVGAEETLFIGDLPSDINAAKKAGCRSCLVFNETAWLYPNEGKIKEINPDFVIKSLSEIFSILNP